MLGRQSFGVRTPIIRENDNLFQIITHSINPFVQSGDIIGITESVVARAQGNYVTIDDMVDEIRRVMNNPNTIILYQPIYSRNRFAMILKAIARAAKERVIIYMPNYDEVGNVRNNHPFTGIDYEKYYTEIVKAEHKECIIFPMQYTLNREELNVIYCGLHNYNTIKTAFPNYFTLADFFKDKCEYGLLGSNKASEEKLKLFPNSQKAQELVEDIKDYYMVNGIFVEVMVYGDGCFKDPVGGIWEFADPVTSPAHTSGLDGTPNEIKLKAFADDKYANLSGDELTSAIKKEIRLKDLDLVGNMSSQGTTPRRKIDLLASLMDLTSGSGDAGTPIVIVRNYDKSFADEI